MCVCVWLGEGGVTLSHLTVTHTVTSVLQSHIFSPTRHLLLSTCICVVAKFDGVACGTCTLCCGPGWITLTCCFRVLCSAVLWCSGKLEAGTYALNANKGKKERIGRLMLMHANNR